MSAAPQPDDLEAAFRALCDGHDLTFDYSDDGLVWREGCASLARVREAAKALQPDVAARIWNSVVDRKLVEGARKSFYWPVSQ